MRNVLFSFLMAGAIVMGGCTPASETDEYQTGAMCIARGDTVGACYAMCTATYSGYKMDTRMCARGVLEARL